jgi:lysozyme
MSKLIEMLRRHEGVETHVYLDTENLETIGVGRNISKTGLGLSDDEVNYLLQNDISRVINELSGAFPWFSGLNEARKDAMISLGFNLGLPRLLKFKNALGSMKENDFEAAADHFLDSRWATQVKGRAIELTDMIRSGEYAITKNSI